jgi:hypothetical protein
VEQVHPFVLAVPARGQVHGDVAAAVAGDAGGDADQLATDGRAAGFRVDWPGQAAGGAGQVEVRAELVAEDVRFVLTLVNAGGFWRYNVSLTSEYTRSQSVASGRVIDDDHMSAVRRAAELAGAGYRPGTVERGLLDALATDGLPAIRLPPEADPDHNAA